MPAMFCKISFETEQDVPDNTKLTGDQIDVKFQNFNDNVWMWPVIVDILIRFIL